MTLTIIAFKSINRYFLTRSTRGAQIPSPVHETISSYGMIKNVMGDGNYGIYAAMQGLIKNCSSSTTDVGVFRK